MTTSNLSSVPFGVKLTATLAEVTLSFYRASSIFVIIREQLKYL